MSKPIKYILIATNLIFSFLSWQSVDRAINSPGSSDFLFPSIYFSLFFISIYLCAILIKEGAILQVLFVASLLEGFVFTFSSWHLVAIFLGIVFVYAGVYKIRRDMKQNIKISLGKAIATGRQYIIIGIAVIVSCQYFLTIKDKDLQYVIPKIQSSKTLDMLTARVLKAINPDFKNISNEDITVDDFIIETQKKQMGDENIPVIPEDQIGETINNQLGDSLPQDQKDNLKKDAQDKLKDISSQLLENNQKIILEESRKNLSLMVGKELSGQEKISEIFPQMINKKITDHFRPELSKKNNLPFLPLVMAIILFLTIVPLGSILNIFWVLISKLIFWILVKTNSVSIKKIPELVEIIE